MILPVARLIAGFAAAALWACADAGAADLNLSSRWSVRFWQSDDGLPNNTVTSLAQTDDGYLWVATPTRLARFDGVEFETISREIFAPGFAYPTSRLLRSRTGGLWLAMDHGPIAFVEGGKVTRFTNGVPEEMVHSLTEDSDGALWMVYRGGYVCRLKDGVVTRFTREDGLPSRTSCALAVDREGRLWFAKGGSVGLFRNGRFDVLERVSDVGTQLRITPARSGGVWIASGSHLFRYVEGRPLETLGQFQPDESESAAPASTLLEDHTGGVWIGTVGNGLFHYDGGGFERVTTSHSEITALFEDAEENLWVATVGGLNQIKPRAISLEATATGLPADSLQSICEGPDGIIWAVTQNGWLICRSNNVWINLSTAPNWPGGRATCVTTDRDGGVWIGTQNRALHRLHAGQFTSWRTADGANSFVIHALLVAANGDVWAAANGPENLYRVRKGKLERMKIPPNLRVIRALAEDPAGNIWAGSSTGRLLRARGDEVTDETMLMYQPFSIRTLMSADDGTLWVGFAGGGVGRLKAGKFARITTAQGLYDDHICQILPDGQGWFWFGGDHGIFKVREQELNDLADGQGVRIHSIHYGRSDALPSLQANFNKTPIALRSRDGRLWMPMSTGLAVVDPRKLREDPQAPPILLTAVAVDGQKVAAYGGPVPVVEGAELKALGRSLRLPPGHHRLDFSFTTLSFGAPENRRFQYRLRGIDDRWIETRSPGRATFSRLSAGNYRFEVIGSNSRGVWNLTGTALDFSVAPFVWQTWWFRLTTLAAFALLVGAAVRYVSFRRLQSRVRALESQAALEKERTRIARDIHDDVGNRLTKITLLSGLAMRDREAPETVTGHVREISATARQVTDSLDEIVWAVNPRNDTLRDLINYISQFAVEFLGNAGIRCRVDLPEHPPDRTVPAEVRHNLFLAVKEALHNVVRHARATEVQLAIVVTDRELCIRIGDNGCGFTGAPENHSSDGLRNMRQRLEEIHGEFRIESRVGEGTRIELVRKW